MLQNTAKIKYYIINNELPKATPTASPSGMLCTVIAMMSKTMRRQDSAAITVFSLFVAWFEDNPISDTVEVAVSDGFLQESPIVPLSLVSGLL